MLTDVKAYLVANGQGSNLFMTRMPDSPDSLVAVYEYPGLPGKRVHNKPGHAYECPELQVLVRDPVAATAYARAKAIWRLLVAVSNTTMAGTLYQQAEPHGSGIAVLKRDELDRTVLVSNYYLMKDP